MSNLTMFDTIQNDQFPADPQAVAGYVDGALGDQPNASWLARAFPEADHLSIAVSARHDADALDVELGAAPPSAVPGWYSRQKARGIARPVLYASALTMAGFVLPVMAAAGIPRAGVRLWSAHYGEGEHICAPSSCGLVPVAMDGTQWCSDALGRNLDQSLLLGGFFAAPVPPEPPVVAWTFGAPQRLAALPGHTTVRLAWQPPEGAPQAPAGYVVFIYAGEACSVRTLVKSYPRRSSALTWEGGSLERKTRYTAHVVATGAGGAHVRGFCYASAAFTTG